MKYGMKLFFVFCLSGMLSGSLLPTNIYAKEEIQTENENGDEESSESKSELPKSSNTAPVYHFSLDKFLTEDEIETAELKSENPNIRSRVTFAILCVKLQNMKDYHMYGVGVILHKVDLIVLDCVCMFIIKFVVQVLI